jgi:hypothetical protein
MCVHRKHLFAVVCVISCLAANDCQVSAAAHRDRWTVSVASEVHIDQAHGRISAPAKKSPSPTPLLIPPPEGRAIVATPQNAPIRCDAQNASTPACHAATQQGRPATR